LRVAVRIERASAPKYAVSRIVGHVRGENAIRLARVYGERKRGCVGQRFRARGYFIPGYIEDREKEHRRPDQMNLRR
jgi:putative transposase